MQLCWPNVSLTQQGRRFAAIIGVVSALILLVGVKCSAQTNIYSVGVYSGGVTEWRVLNLGSEVAITKVTYWSDLEGRVISWYGNTNVGKAVGDTFHVDTRVRVGSKTLTIPLSPLILLIISALIVPGLLAIVIFALTRRGRANVAL